MAMECHPGCWSVSCCIHRECLLLKFLNLIFFLPPCNTKLCFQNLNMCEDWTLSIVCSAERFVNLTSFCRTREEVQIRLYLFYNKTPNLNYYVENTHSNSCRFVCLFLAKKVTWRNPLLSSLCGKIQYFCMIVVRITVIKRSSWSQYQLAVYSTEPVV